MYRPIWYIKIKIVSTLNFCWLNIVLHPQIKITLPLLYIGQYSYSDNFFINSVKVLAGFIISYNVHVSYLRGMNQINPL